MRGLIVFLIGFSKVREVLWNLTSFFNDKIGSWAINKRRLSRLKVFVPVIQPHLVALR